MRRWVPAPAAVPHVDPPLQAVALTPSRAGVNARPQLEHYPLSRNGDGAPGAAEDCPWPRAEAATKAPINSSSPISSSTTHAATEAGRWNSGGPFIEAKRAAK
eukprot:CAMPEP_0185321418 /NCGR_PEP_ID=MMETSP1363-20130426/57062_1 /TAXON_ID=38817 /ORGANISM="Gephyrocapsa oceanica, Strain RCC1303" /LENGTH=102 /DNA_ID=CAMNT_0027919913 /DNA_START=46 /DNA_END=355 /DNA_ORIENTATION=+